MVEVSLVRSRDESVRFLRCGEQLVEKVVERAARDFRFQ
jgi:hypothetical protein